MAAVELERAKAAVDIGVTKMVNEPNTHVEARKRNRQATNSTISSCDMWAEKKQRARHPW